MRKLLITITLLTFCVITEAKKYPFDMKHQYRVEQIRVAEDGGRLIKAWGVASNADKAIIQALHDAVACCIFMGLEAKNSTTIGHNANALPSLCPEGLKAYDENKATIQTILEFLKEYSDHEIIHYKQFNYISPGLQNSLSHLILTNKCIMVVYQAKEVVFKLDLNVKFVNDEHP